MNARGQAIVESVLFLVAFLAITLFVAQYFKQQELVSQMVSGPWQRLSGMLQNGVWMPPAEGALWHPAYFPAGGGGRAVSYRPEVPK